MYSLVLMTAMSTTPNAPDFNGYFRDLFFGNCSGCSGYTAPRYSCSGGSNYPASCNGSYYNGCNGSYYPANCSGSYYNGCNGCNGDTFLNRVRRFFQPSNCCGGSGSGYGFGCSGSAAYSCFGSSSAAYSCFGGPAVSYTPVFNGGQSCYGGPIPSAPAPIFEPYPGLPTLPGVVPPIPYAPPEPAPGTNLNTGLKPASQHGFGPGLEWRRLARSRNGDRSPASRCAALRGRPAAGLHRPREEVRDPRMPADQSFTYRFRIEYDRDGETVSVTKRVPIRAGGMVTIEFGDLTARAQPVQDPPKHPITGGSDVAATPTAHSSDKPVQNTERPAVSTPSSSTGRAAITVKLPPGATLYVNELKSPSNDPVRRFSTPPIPTGRDFAYLMKAEIVRNGQTETFTQKVPFRAGERVEVDFSTVGR